MKVLFISAWYPNRYDEMAGLFVRKHAQAVSQFCDVEVLYIHPATDINRFEICVKNIDKLKETTVYFPAKSNNSVQKLIKQLNYLIAYYKGWQRLKKSGYSPDIIHANILTRTGLMAYFIRLFTSIPYVITEHWSRYLPLRNSYHGAIRKKVTKIVAAKAEAIFPVSENLKNAMILHGINNQSYKVINNTVDNFFFKQAEKTDQRIVQILHVSCFDEQAKNLKGMLNAVKVLSEKRTDFKITLIGTGIDFELIYNFAQSLNFPEEMIEFMGEKMPTEVAEYMQQSDFFVLFSNYENSPVVISESLACGKPVISSNVGGISEHINSSNGILIAPRDEEALAESIDYMLDHFSDYKSAEIQSVAKSKFSMEAVGKEIYEQYLKALKLKHNN